MDKVYLLLRNNQESGPFTIGELLQQQLRPSDMVWIEGKSTAWTYLSELELTPHIEKEISKPAIPSKSSDEIERKAEELRQKVLSAAPKAFHPAQTEIETYSSSFKLPDNEIEFVDHRKEKHTRRNMVFAELLLTCFVIALFMFGIYKGKSFLSTKKQVHETVATQLDSRDEHAAQKNNQQQQLPLSLKPDTTQVSADSLVAVHNFKPRPSAVKKTIADTSKTNLIVPVIPPADSNSQKKKAVANKIQAPEEIPVKKENSADKEKTTSKPQASDSESNKQEKKGFLRGLFKKKKKADNPDKDEDKKKDNSSDN